MELCFIFFHCQPTERLACYRGQAMGWEGGLDGGVLSWTELISFRILVQD